jgi:hypothetical protein
MFVPVALAKVKMLVLILVEVTLVPTAVVKVNAPPRFVTPKKGDPQIATRLKEQSRIQYGRPREEVEQEIIKRSGMIVS